MRGDILQNVFNLFGIERDIMEQVREFEKIGKAYSSFFEKMNQQNKQEPITEEKIGHSNEDIKEQMIEGLQQTDELKEVYEATEDQPEWIRTGIKEDPDGRKRYRCRYHCYICNQKGTHYIFEASTEIKCHSCRMHMPVSPAHPEGFPKQDTHGNFYRAGEYQDWKLT